MTLVDDFYKQMEPSIKAFLERRILPNESVCKTIVNYLREVE